MKHVSLPKHDDTTRALLIDGPVYEGWLIYVPCRLSNDRELQIPVASREGYGIHTRKQPILLIPAHAKPELAIATLQIRRIVHTKNLMEDTPHCHIDDAVAIDLTSYRAGLGEASTRTGRFAYVWPHGREKSLATGRAIHELRIGAESIHHPELDAIEQADMDAAQAELDLHKSWKKLYCDHITGRLTIVLPGIDTVTTYAGQDLDEMPLVYCKYMHTGAGRGLNSDAFSTDYAAKLAPVRHELIQFIEMLSGMSAMVSNDIEFTYDGATPSITFKHKDKRLDLRVNDLPMIGRFLVVDPSKEDFDSMLTTYETLTLAINSITTRLTQ
ncbi:hypothetical protein pEaSNUABM5_00323 [Erwinia phage pEa_SNUABM_5]|uniref:Uncharacterized protein n=1 Tax=Erwinia phage pEa_SNUABM_5 TaxID=2797313 RepID=A0A7T8IVT5_9CAUD|nr:hypothetical protein MPK73_gp323 [Erwinia phage pEa_SNUABM_5]QQO90465.1 hypothetical protein pEaSNUABM5_00323 [Erwinia phage pEa_SNUABM_5]